MKMKTLRRIRAMAPRQVRRRDFDLSDAMEPEAGPSPEAIFDRSTGPFDRRRAAFASGGFDEET
ncbi:MAG: hypothetical protein AB7T06_02430 [Kofleriaceae bacterium]